MAYQPKSYRKFLAGTVSAAVVASAIAPVASASFTDVAGSVHADDIATLVAKGYIKGYGDGTFKPNKSLTRGEAAIIFSRILKDAGVTQKGAGFPDVPAEKAELAEAVAIVQAAGIMTGDEKGNFNPNANITREQMAKVVVEAFKLTKPANHTTKVTDLDKAGSWAREYIQTLEANGVTKNTEFMPKQNVTRGQFASFVVRAMNVGVTAANITGVAFVDLNTLEVTFNGELKEVKKEDFAIAGVEIESVSIKAAAAAEAKTTVVVIKTKTALEEGKAYNVSYKGQTTDKAKVDVPVVTPKVESVSAINAKKIEVKFNKEVNKTTAENSATYNFVGLTSGTTWTPVLQADGKTVVLTLNKAIANDTTFVAIVNEVETKADSTKKTEKFTKTITFSDTTKPTFTGVTYPEAGIAVLNFSEDLSTPGTVKVYDGNTDVTSTLTITHNANSNQISISGLTTNKEYRVVVVGAKDQSSNLIPSPVEVFVKSTVSEQVKPVIESITTVDLNTIKVKFSEKLKQISAGVYANVSIDGVAVTGATQTFDSETNTLTITKAGLTTAGIHSVSISGYTDLSNNVGDTFTKAVAFAASAPVLEKTEVVSDATDTYVVLTFNEAPSLAAIQAVDITGTYTTPENILKTFGSAALNESTDISVVGNTIKIKVTGKEAGNYKLTIPAAGISDGTTARTQDLEITFTLTGSADTTRPTVSNVFIPGENATAVGGPATVERNTVYVKYSKSMNSTAVNPDNYTVDGQKVFESAVFVGDKTLVKLTLKEGVITLTGDRSFQISNAVTGENGVAINAYSSTEPFVENVKPLLSSGVVIDGTTIELTFTEAVADANLVAAGAGNDFEVYIDGAKSTIANVVTGATANDNKLQLQLSSPITPEQLASSTITVKVLDSTDGADVNGNPLTKGTVITVAK
ncbi:hypothetical protein BO219_13290 [Anoxybacillus kestanbolensis]|uniref:SLH domain-containing protein n=1 Tax=Anoxybacillus kestanbolensis TaxID=227476 RepID=A0A1V3FEV2_9BACL|nr:S-layer homology domain-containing protein [Anoxybacillus kestanbolensis]OOE00186.1 hypothetical protein BO219_13290 [Anoxybacillus kestanbolensis]